MKRVLNIIVPFLLYQISWSQTPISQSPIIKEGIIETSYVKDGNGELVQYSIKNTSKIVRVARDGNGIQLVVFQHAGYDKLGHIGLFEVKGNSNAFGFYSSRANIWAIPYEGSIYFINSPIQTVKSYHDLNIELVMGEEIADKIDLYNYYREYYCEFADLPYLPVTRAEESLTCEDYEKMYSIKENSIESTTLAIKPFKKFKLYKQYDMLFMSGEITFDNGETLTTIAPIICMDRILKQFEFKFSDPRIIRYPSTEPDMQNGWYFYVNEFVESSSSIPLDYLEVTILNKETSEEISSQRIANHYDNDVFLDLSGNRYQRAGYNYYNGLNGAEIDMEISNIAHSETNENLILYTLRITDPKGQQTTKYVKLKPEAKLSIDYSGGKGKDIEQNGTDNAPYGGNPGKLTLTVSDDVLDYNMEHFGSYGSQGSLLIKTENFYNSDTDLSTKGSISSNTNSSDVSKEIIIINNTGKGVCIVQGGASRTIGSKESYDCDDDIFYGVMDGNNCKSTKGAKIASADSDCGRTITLE